MTGDVAVRLGGTELEEHLAVPVDERLVGFVAHDAGSNEVPPATGGTAEPSRRLPAGAPGPARIRAVPRAVRLRLLLTRFVRRARFRWK